jgi:hypothetical protein
MKRIIQSTAIALLAALQLWSCAKDEFQGEMLTNEPPSVWLSSAPPEGTLANYTLHMWWGGWDPDGEIAYYEYAITNNESGVFDEADTVSTAGDYKWSRVVANDSIFTFSADLIPDSSAIDFEGGPHRAEEFQRSHTFFIRAVDENGERSLKPAYRSFTSRTLSPTVFVDIPARSGLNAAQVPPITTFQWTAKDFISTSLEVTEPVGVRHILVPLAEHDHSWGEGLRYIRDNLDAEEWSPWRDYQASGDSGKFWTSPPLDFGEYYFAVQVMDEAGAISPVFDLNQNLRRVLVSSRTTGPLLRMTNRFIGTVLTSSPNTPPTILDLPANVSMDFEFQSNAQSYGGVVSGYRYGWDIEDLNDDEQWEIDYTPFMGVDNEGWTTNARSPRRTFFFGTHSFFIEVVDNSGFKTRIEVRVNIVPFTFENPLLMVDDWIEGSPGFAGSQGGLPSDQEHDLFWLEMLNTVSGFNPSTDVFELNVGGRTEIPIQMLAKYKTLIWSANGSPSAQSGSYLLNLIRFLDPDIPQGGGRTQPNLISLFMSAGGRVLLTGESLMTLSINRTSFGQSQIRYPIIFRYELGGDQDGRYGDSDVGVSGVGDNSFAWSDCCLNVLDLSYVSNRLQIRQPPDQQKPPGTGCPVNQLRSNIRRTDGLRRCRPLDRVTAGGFPALDLRPEVAGDASKFFHESRSGLVSDVYNPRYFTQRTECRTVTENIPFRSCFRPIYGNGCLNTGSLIYNQPVAFWTNTFENRIPDAGGSPARSAVWGFHPVYFQPIQVKRAIEIVLHDEWGLPRQ